MPVRRSVNLFARGHFAVCLSISGFIAPYDVLNGWNTLLWVPSTQNYKIVVGSSYEAVVQWGNSLTPAQNASGVPATPNAWQVRVSTRTPVGYGCAFWSGSAAGQVTNDPRTGNDYDTFLGESSDAPAFTATDFTVSVALGPCNTSSQSSSMSSWQSSQSSLVSSSTSSLLSSEQSSALSSSSQLSSGCSSSSQLSSQLSSSSILSSQLSSSSVLSSQLSSSSGLSSQLSSSSVLSSQLSSSSALSSSSSLLTSSSSQQSSSSSSNGSSSSSSRSNQSSNASSYSSFASSSSGIAPINSNDYYCVRVTSYGTDSTCSASVSYVDSCMKGSALTGSFMLNSCEYYSNHWQKTTMLNGGVGYTSSSLCSAACS